MSVTARQLEVFNQLEAEELNMVSNHAASIIRNRTDHTDAYRWFQEARERMLKKNPMSDEGIDCEIHS